MLKLLEPSSVGVFAVDADPDLGDMNSYVERHWFRRMNAKCVGTILRLQMLPFFLKIKMDTKYIRETLLLFAQNSDAVKWHGCLAYVEWCFEGSNRVWDRVNSSSIEGWKHGRDLTYQHQEQPKYDSMADSTVIWSSLT